MRQKSISQKDPAEKVVRDIRRKTRRKHSTEEKIRIVLEGLRGDPPLNHRLNRPKCFDDGQSSWEGYSD